MVTNEETHDPVWPTLLDLERALTAYAQTLDAGCHAQGCDFAECDEDVCAGCSDVRLRVHGGGWYLHTGDASYDQDHRGFIGASSVAADDTAETLRATAEDLIDQARDMQAQGED